MSSPVDPTSQHHLEDGKPGVTRNLIRFILVRTPLEQQPEGENKEWRRRPRLSHSRAPFGFSVRPRFRMSSDAAGKYENHT